MLQHTHWVPSEKFGNPVNYNGINERLTQVTFVQNYHSDATLLDMPGEPLFPPDALLAPYPGCMSRPITSVHPLIHDITATRPYMTGEQDNMSPRDDQSQKSVDIMDQFLQSLDGNGLSLPNDVLWPILIPYNRAMGPSTHSIMTNQSSQSPVRPFARGTPVTELVDTEHHRKTVGSSQIQQAACKRRKKDGVYQCEFRNAGCNATFTTTHNLRYHLNAHRGLKPYKCGKCPYAADSPTTLKRHTMKRH